MARAASNDTDTGLVSRCRDETAEYISSWELRDKYFEFSEASLLLLCTTSTVGLPPKRARLETEEKNVSSIPSKTKDAQNQKRLPRFSDLNKRCAFLHKSARQNRAQAGGLAQSLLLASLGCNDRAGRVIDRSAGGRLPEIAPSSCTRRRAGDSAQQLTSRGRSALTRFHELALSPAASRVQACAEVTGAWRSLLPL